MLPPQRRQLSFDRALLERLAAVASLLAAPIQPRLAQISNNQEKVHRIRTWLVALGVLLQLRDELVKIFLFLVPVLK